MLRTARHSAPARHRQRWLGALLGVAALLGSGRTQAQDVVSDTASEATDAPREEAKQHFERGLELARESGNWEAALAEFLKSRSIYPTRSATRNAAIALRELGRRAESYELYRLLLAEFSSSMSAEELASAEADRAALEPLIGKLEIAVATPGAAVLVDGQPRGSTPLAAPLAVEPGRHVVRVAKDGFEPYELTISVGAGSRVSVGQELRRLEPNPPSEVPPSAPSPASPEKEPAAPERPLRFFVEAFLGGVLAGSVNGDANQNCNCSENSLALGFVGGARFGYLALERLGVELSAGYLSIQESMTRTMVADGDLLVSDLRSEDYEDSTRLAGPFAALTASYRFLEATPITVRAGFGVALFTSHTENSGTFSGVLKNPEQAAETKAFETPMSIEEAEQHLATPFGTTEARLGLRFSRRISADFGVGLFLFFPKQALRVGTTYFENSRAREEFFGATGDTWTTGGQAVVPGLVSLPEESIAGPFLAVVPSVALKVAF